MVVKVITLCYRHSSVFPCISIARWFCEFVAPFKTTPNCRLSAWQSGMTARRTRICEVGARLAPLPYEQRCVVVAHKHTSTEGTEAQRAIMGTCDLQLFI